MKPTRYFQMQIDIPGDHSNRLPSEIHKWAVTNKLWYSYLGRTTNGLGDVVTHYKFFRHMRAYTASAFALVFPECKVHLQKEYAY